MQQRFEAVFYDGEEDRRSQWCVVEWVMTRLDGSRSGINIKKFPGNLSGQQQAEELAAVLNREHAFGEYA
jgi:hypothetical protein